MPPTPDFLKLLPREAIEYFRQKIAVPTEFWAQFDAEQHDFAYTVASLTRADLLESMRFLIDQAIAEGVSFETFNKQFKRLVQRRGWTPDPLPAGPSDWRMRIIFETPIRRSYGAGRLKQMRDPDVMSTRPYWLWKHGDSPSPRMHHLELHNQVFRADDPFWDIAYPPCGYGCKCRAFSIGDRHLKVRGLSVGMPPDPYTVAQKGFRRAPGTTPEAERRDVLEQGISRLSPELAEQVRLDLEGQGLLGERGDAVERQDDRRIWVKDRRVKGGGYYRRISGSTPQEKEKKAKNNKGWLIWFEGRRTAVAVSARSKQEAIEKARKGKKQGGEDIVTVRRPTEAERRISDRGGWIRTGPNGEKPGQGDLRGYGPKPKAYRGDAVERQDDRRVWVDDESVRNGGYWRRQREGKNRTKISPFVSRKELSELSRVKQQKSLSGVNKAFFVEDRNGKQSVFKSADSPFETAAELLVSEIAGSIGAKVNQVRLLPGGAKLKANALVDPGSDSYKLKLTGSTLHDLVPGVPVGQQGTLPTSPPIYLPLGLPINSRTTDNQKTFRQSLSHPDLARIMALDVFTGNSDRHGGNLLYDEKEGFYGVDHGLAFSSGTAAEMYVALEKYDVDAELTISEKENLGILVSSLKELTQKNSSGSIVNRLRTYSNAASSGLAERALTGAGVPDEGRLRDEFEGRKSVIEYNHRKSQDLVLLLEPQIKKPKSRSLFGRKK